MKKGEALKKKEELKKEINDLYTDILKEMCNKKEYLSDGFWKNIGRKLHMEEAAYGYITYDNDFYFAKWDYADKYKNEFEGLSEEETEKLIIEKEKEFEEQTKTLKKMLDRHLKLKYDLAFRIDRLMDMEMEFDGDIIITDPCYVMKRRNYSSMPKWNDYMSYSNIKYYPDYDSEKQKSDMFSEENKKYSEAEEKWREENSDDWDVCKCGSQMEKLGFTKYMTRDTLYGDWSCTTYDLDTKEEIGEFCADAGLVSVFLLDEVMKYNPDYKHVEEKSWCVTCIRDFKGTVEFRVEHHEGIYEDTTDYHKAGDKWEEDEVKVYGHGINKVTGKPINFVGTQTGL